jgi:hypothetical protein
MNELIRHFIVFFPLFVFIRWKFKKWTPISFLIFPAVGEIIQITPIFQYWEFQFEWDDMLINYISSAMGWSFMSAIRENQKIRYRKYRQILNFNKRGKYVSI